MLQDGHLFTVVDLEDDLVARALAGTDVQGLLVGGDHISGVGAVALIVVISAGVISGLALAEELVLDPAGVAVYLDLAPAGGLVNHMNLFAGLEGGDNGSGSAGGLADLDLAGAHDPRVIVHRTGLVGNGRIAGGLDLLFAQPAVDHVAFAHVSGIDVVILGAVSEDLHLSALGKGSDGGEIAVRALAQGGAVAIDPGIIGRCLLQVLCQHIAVKSVGEGYAGPAVSIGAVDLQRIVPAVASDDLGVAAGQVMYFQGVGVHPVPAGGGSDAGGNNQDEHEHQCD